MSRLFLVSCLLLFVAIGFAQQPNKYEVAGIRDPDGVEKCLSKIQQAVALNDRDALKSLIQFPVQYGAMGSGGSMLGEQDFTARYEEIINNQVKRILARQKLDDLVVNQFGVAIGNGEIWFNQLSGSDGFKITAFNFSKYSGAGIESLSDAAKMDAFFLELKQAVARNDRNAVAAMLHYPIWAGVQKRRVRLRSKRDLLRYYDLVFNDRIKSALTEQKIPNLTALTNGIMVGNGEIWFSQILVGQKWEIKVIALNN